MDALDRARANERTVHCRRCEILRNKTQSITNEHFMLFVHHVRDHLREPKWFQIHSQFARLHRIESVLKFHMLTTTTAARIVATIISSHAVSQTLFHGLHRFAFAIAISSMLLLRLLVPTLSLTQTKCLNRMKNDQRPNVNWIDKHLSLANGFANYI